jgi:outer membrane protein TolC
LRHEAEAEGSRGRPALRFRKGSTSAGVLTLGATLFACVSDDLGYQDVRSLTSARIGRDVRWDEHESSGHAKAQTKALLAKPLDAGSAVQIALLNNQGLQAAFEELGVARARYVQALQLPNPTLDGALRYRGGDSDEPSIEVEALIDISQLFFLAFRGGVANAEAEAAKASVAGRVLDLALQTRVAFYGYQAAEQTLELRRSILVALRASFEAAQNLHTAGNITDLSYANEQALYEESRVAYTRAEATLRAAREELSALLGLWGKDGDWTAEPRLADELLTDESLPSMEGQAIERSLDLEIIRRRFEAAARGANVARARGWMPELRGGVAAEREEGQWGIGPAVAIEVPLFYQGQGEAGVALAQMRQEQKFYSDAAVRIRATSRSVAARLQLAAKSATYYKSVLLPLRERIVKETQLQYNAMSLGIFQLLQAKRDQIETARTYVEVLREYWVLRAEADQLLAGRLPRQGSLIETSGGGEAVMEETG